MQYITLYYDSTKDQRLSVDNYIVVYLDTPQLVLASIRPVSSLS